MSALFENLLLLCLLVSRDAYLTKFGYDGIERVVVKGFGGFTAYA